MVIKTFIAICFCGALLAVNAAHAASPTEIYVVRHAETVGNVTHKHTYENDRTFSSKGKRQVVELTRRLGALQFDAIVVSPKYRTLSTILPYLKKHALVAEIWPELQECCWQKTGQRISSFNLQRGGKIHLEPQMKRYFKFPNAKSQKKYSAKNYGDGLLQTFKAIQLIRKRFAGSGKRVLVVAHYHIGSRLIEILQGIEPNGRYQLSNAKVTHLRKKSDGSFRLVSLNQ